MQIIQSPSGYLRVGQNVTLTCVATGDPYPQVSWLMRDGSLQQRSIMTIPYVTDTMMDGYTCVAVTGTRRYTEVWYLKVQSKFFFGRTRVHLVGPLITLILDFVCPFQWVLTQSRMCPSQNSKCTPYVRNLICGVQTNFQFLFLNCGK